MPEEKEVPADIINALTEQILKELDQLRKTLMYKNKEVEDEFISRVVAIFGALILMLEQHVQYMFNHGYTPEHLDRIEKMFLDSFIFLDSKTVELLKAEEEPELKN